MKLPETFKRFLRAALLNPRAIIFGVAVFNVVWSWSFMSVPYSSQRIMTPLILVAALGLLLNKSWSNLLAAVLGGYYVIGFVIWFLEIPPGAGVRLLSREHFDVVVQMDRVFQLSLMLAIVILCYASSAILRAARSHRP